MPPADITRDELLEQFCLVLHFRGLLELETDLDLELTDEELEMRMLLDQVTLYSIVTTRYLGSRSSIPRSGSLETIWQYYRDPDYHHLFNKLVRVKPATFHFILNEIKDHPVFQNNSHVPQAPVELQLAIALHRLGRYGNAVSMDDEAFLAGVGHGTIPLYTQRVIKAILSLHGRFIHSIDDEARAREREWVRERIGCPEFAAGIFQYDGTIVELWQKPGFHGNAYFHRNRDYGLNVQIGCLGSNLQITDYSLGFTGSAHDSLAFQHTAAYKYPDQIFRNDEFAWADSAYTPSYRVIPVHKAPHNRDPRVRAFDKAVAHLRVRSEHCNGSLKARFQCLRGMRVAINSRADHLRAMRQISACLVLHNMCIAAGGDYWEPDEEPERREWDEAALAEEEEELAGAERRRTLVDAYHRYRQARRPQQKSLVLLNQGEE